MRSSSAAVFCKYKTCPSADVILSYCVAKLAPEAEQQVANHLSVCEFCGAEMNMIAHHSPCEIPAESVPCEMPASLRRLAEDLLGVQTAGALGKLYEAVYAREGVTLTDA
jgi:hypothetical protein